MDSHKEISLSNKDLLVHCNAVIVRELMNYAISLSMSYQCSISGTITISSTPAVHKPLMLLKMQISHG